MPALYYGRMNSSGRQLYNDQLEAFETSIFDQYKIEDLAPYSKRRHVANFWWLEGKHPHSMLAWHDEFGTEAVVLIPGHLSWQDTMTLARELFKPVVPSAITFRLNNYKRPYSYDR